MLLRTVAIVLTLLVTTSSAAGAAAARVGLLPPAHPGARILIVAPHIDDEALAAGGYAVDAIAAGAEVWITYLTAGDHSRSALVANRLTFFATASFNRKGERRFREAITAGERLGVAEERLILLGYPDRGLTRMQRRPDHTHRSASTGRRAVHHGSAMSPGAPYRIDSLARDLAQILAEIEPDIVIAPSKRDRHPDHRAAAVLVSEALASSGATPVRLGYMIHGKAATFARRLAARVEPSPETDAEEWLVYPLSRETADEKHRIMAAYRSQQRSPYLRFLFQSIRGRSEIFLTEPDA
jgi:LmbE family N-acetylglucosaminyl deacetylase